MTSFWRNLKEIFWPSKIKQETDHYDEKFHLWAYGTKNKAINGEIRVKNWNALHGDKLTLLMCGEIGHDLELMHKLFQDHLNAIQEAENALRAK